jgi:hypothetical protein
MSISVVLAFLLNPAFCYACFKVFEFALTMHFFSSDTDLKTFTCRLFPYFLEVNLLPIQ